MFEICGNFENFEKNLDFLEIWKKKDMFENLEIFGIKHF